MNPNMADVINSIEWPTLVEVATRLCPSEYPLTYSIGPPATVDEIRSIEDAIGRGIPSELRDCFLHTSKHIEFDWFFDDEICDLLPEALEYCTGGCLRITLDSLVGNVVNLSSFRNSTTRACRKSAEYRFEMLFPLQWVADGDMLAIVEGGSNDGSVIILAEQTLMFNKIFPMHCARLGTSIGAFLQTWSKLAFVGPEEWSLLPFYDEERDILVADNSAAKEFRQFIGLE